MNDISSLSKDDIQKIVKQKIKNNSKFLDERKQNVMFHERKSKTAMKENNCFMKKTNTYF